MFRYNSVKTDLPNRFNFTFVQINDMINVTDKLFSLLFNLTLIFHNVA